MKNRDLKFNFIFIYIFSKLNVRIINYFNNMFYNISGKGGTFISGHTNTY